MRVAGIRIVVDRPGSSFSSRWSPARRRISARRSAASLGDRELGLGASRRALFASVLARAVARNPGRNAGIPVPRIRLFLFGGVRR
jgi:hypothetical protein